MIVYLPFVCVDLYPLTSAVYQALMALTQGGMFLDSLTVLVE